jgi:hypothetical protein
MFGGAMRQSESDRRLPLGYADPALNRADRTRNDQMDGPGWRRLGFGFGLAMILLGFALGSFPRSGEAQFCLAVGGFVFGCAIPGLRSPRTRGDE